MKRLPVLLIILALLYSPLKGDGKKTVVVINFKSANESQEMGVAVSELLRGILTTLKQQKYNFIEREQLNALLKEKELSLSGVIDDNKSNEIGKVLSADYMIIGTVTRLGGNYFINARIVNSKTGKIKTGSRVQAKSSNEIPGKVNELAYILVGLKGKSTNILKAIDDPPPVRDNHYEYNSWYSDSRGTHRGGQIVLDIKGKSVTGKSIESYGVAEMKGQISGNRIVGFYKASYGYGNFEFIIKENWRVLDGHYYQVSNGAKGKWVGKLK